MAVSFEYIFPSRFPGCGRTVLQNMRPTRNSHQSITARLVTGRIFWIATNGRNGVSRPIFPSGNEQAARKIPTSFCARVQNGEMAMLAAKEAFFDRQYAPPIRKLLQSDCSPNASQSSEHLLFTRRNPHSYLLGPITKQAICCSLIQQRWNHRHSLHP
jgi:hypothetical protein